MVVAVRVLAEEGNPKAQHNLGALYMQGRGVEQDFKEAAKWLLLAAEQGDHLSQHNLGILNLRGLGTPVDHTAAFGWFSRAAVQGNPRSLFNLGGMLLEGLGVEQDLEQAYMWFCLAAEESPAAARQETETVRDHVADLLSPEQIERAHASARQWRLRHDL
ncbi:MAG: sel1 repeat family protein [Magnetococcales bacterium]|nr:sel1 repeat family protein [Magnetococcales bacterium]MBF0322104.1 sel1 repeat family protein [Magnetococcales bacterium]